MSGDSDMTAALSKSTALTSIPAGIIAHDTGDAYLDVSTMDGAKVIFLVDVAGSDTNTALVIKDGAEFSAGAVGNLTLETSAAGTYVIGPLETARFKDSDGYIRFAADTADTTDITMTAILLP